MSTPCADAPAGSAEDEAACIAAVTGGRARVGTSGIGEGRGLFAAVAVQAGEALFEEPAFVSAAGNFGMWECICHACTAPETDAAELRRCAGCRWAHWCSDACAAAGAASHTAGECAAMARLRYRTLDLPGCVVMAARLLRGNDSEPPGSLRAAQAALARTLVGTSDALPPLTRAEFDTWAPTVAALAACATPPSEADAVATLCALLRNEFRVLDARDVAAGVALFPAAARMNHACTPNVRAFTVEAGWTLKVEALVPLAAGDELRLSYVEPSGAASCRAAHLRARFLFDCACGAPNCASRGAED